MPDNGWMNVELKTNFNTKTIAKDTTWVKQQTVMRHLNIAAQRAETEMLGLFNRTVRTWNTQPNFYHSVVLNQYDTIRVIVGTDDEHYAWVNGGTKRHDITAKRKPFLWFQNMSAKTSPGALTSTSVITAGRWYKAITLTNSGIKKRDFVGQIRAIMKQRLPEIVAVELRTG